MKATVYVRCQQEEWLSGHDVQQGGVPKNALLKAAPKDQAYGAQTNSCFLCGVGSRLVSLAGRR